MALFLANLRDGLAVAASLSLADDSPISSFDDRDTYDGDEDRSDADVDADAGVDADADADADESEESEGEDGGAIFNFCRVSGGDGEVTST